MNDLIYLAMERASASFGDGHSDNVFSAAGFSNALMALAGVDGALDGKVVRVLLAGRSDVEILPGNYYRFDHGIL